MMVSSKGRYALRVMLYLAQNDREELVPLKEIAEILTMNLNTVKAKLYRGLKKLKVQMQEGDCI